MKNKPKPKFRPKKQTKSALKKTLPIQAALLGKKKKPAKKTGKNKIGTLDNANLHKMEKELRETKERLHLLSEATEEGIAIHDKGIILDANDALARIFGYELSEIIGMKAERLATPESWKVIREHIAKKYDKPYDGVGVRKDGSTFICSLVGKPYKYKGRTLRLSAFHDITERKQAEESLRETELKFRTIFDSASDGILLAQSSNRKFFSANETICAMLGYTKEELLKLGVTDIHPEKSVPYVNEQFNKLLEKEISVTQNIPLLKKDKTVFFADISASQITLDEKEYLIGIFRDITERKRSEEEIKSAKVFLDMVIDMSPFAMWISDKEGTITRVNHSLCNVINLKEDEIVGKYNVLKDLNLEIQGVMPLVRAVFVKHEPARFIIPWKAADASDVDFKGARDMHIDVSMFPILNAQGELINVVCQWVDITERKKSEEALLESEIKYRTLFESASDTIFLMDHDIFIDCNQKTLEMFRCTKEQIIGQPPYRFSPEFQPDGSNSKEKALEKNAAALRGQPQYFEWKHLRYDGTPFDAEISLNAINDMGKNYIQAICRNITERKQAEEELKKYRDHLEELVRERTIKLEASNKELEAFSYSASHDLRAPLRIIDGFSQALLEDCEDKLDVQGKDYLVRIRAATRHMAELIDDLLQLSRITRAEMNVEKINLTRIARFVIDELQKSQPQRHVEIRITDGMEETADSRLMCIVLENLLGNAWKFTEKQAKALIEFGCTKKGKKKAYFIRDNGVGFDMAYADKLFAPFQRLHTDNEFPGTGIGLATVQRIIHRHGGRVWTEGQTGKGATFYFSLNEK